MGRFRSVLTTAACAALMALTLAPTARAGDLPGPTDDLSGRWTSASLRLDGVGYSLTLIPAEAGSGPGGSYSAVLRMTFQDGTRGPRVKSSLTVDDRRLVLRLGGGGGLLNGTIGMDGSINFASCYKHFDYVAKSDAPTMCMFQEFPR